MKTETEPGLTRFLQHHAGILAIAKLSRISSIIKYFGATREVVV